MLVHHTELSMKKLGHGHKKHLFGVSYSQVHLQMAAGLVGSICLIVGDQWISVNVTGMVF